MMERECGQIRELIPDFVAGRVAEEEAASVQAHLRDCAECRDEVELVSLLLASRPEAPADLASRLEVAVRRSRPAAIRPWWAVTAAAIAALALGIGIASDPPSGVDVEVPAFAYEVDEGVLWSSDDGLVAGAPMLDQLSDEALEQLLDELVLGSTGGAA